LLSGGMLWSRRLARCCLSSFDMPEFPFWSFHRTVRFHPPLPEPCLHLSAHTALQCHSVVFRLGHSSCSVTRLICMKPLFVSCRRIGRPYVMSSWQVLQTTIVLRWREAISTIQRGFGRLPFTWRSFRARTWCT